MCISILHRTIIRTMARSYVCKTSILYGVDNSRPHHASLPYRACGQSRGSQSTGTRTALIVSHDQDLESTFHHRRALGANSYRCN